MKKMKWLMLSVYFMPLTVFAYGQGYGDIASGLFSDVLDIRKVMRAVFIVTGVALILGSFLQYRKHRQNPIEVTMGSVIMTLFIGLMMIALSFIPLGVTGRS
ncbi:MAG: hypothetical protein KAT71_02375 [Gammaproteobacteria bacterium]|nr:hypothetical protein [Gammaproteobacteria bacterium]